MGLDFIFPQSMLPFVELYKKHDPTLLIQTKDLMPFQRSFIFLSVAIIVRTLTRLSLPTFPIMVDFSLETLCRFGIKLPVLEKLVATSHKPILVLEAYKGIQESAK